MTDNFVDLDALNLPRTNAPQQPFPPDACTHGCRCTHAAGEVSAGNPRTAPSPAGPGLLAEIRDAVFQVRVIADEWLKQIGDRAINRALSRDFGLTYDKALDAAAEALAEAEAEYEVYEPVADEEPMQVGLEELAAHITAIRRCCSPSRWAADVTVSDEIARDLLADFHITRKK
ncbi:hypothetical protein BIB8_35 [Mycobacterium phage BIB8]|uniref:Uncharacterized protein n=2 Tax=Brujitavirus brujita TaxID=561996 RepID=B5U3A6_9CAUD|nr:gp38 [Mycobacterium phage Brujita]ADL71220.1 hypothetical protein ISLAND3_38 [Mycobacterium phage Island3]WAW19121.1 hypothetical protein BIB10_35 [Mycobacterium phage BIB10]WAW19183.1 hypothetical protein BIB9_35 [Mycobacterium phage BIB9]WAW19245.1 hypothetical protein BIB8_35 [Mycobacterium phage BIB8]WAW19307.1 hypothetical protein BIB7_35 [Mycobacterium phage BIB7]WAW19369.1 hypothetical protein BIB6_35 [Mycobacterium phage BIB6]WAW19431.1 hypothetical protein PBI_BIB4_35 [Mycobacter